MQIAPRESAARAAACAPRSAGIARPRARQLVGGGLSQLVGDGLSRLVGAVATAWLADAVAPPRIDQLNADAAPPASSALQGEGA